MACDPAREAQLAAQGWRRRFMADQPRLGEAVAMYRRMGLEVHLEPVDPAACQSGEGCAACLGQPQAADRCKVIFTRQPAGPAPDGRLPTA